MIVGASCSSPKDASTQPAGGDGPARSDSVSAEGDPVDAGFDMSQVPGGIHVVEPGDTLWSLAEKYYGSGKQWRQILVANRNRLEGSTDLPVGMKLIIP